MDTLNPYCAVTLALFAVYLLLALFGSRERGAAAPRRGRDLRRRLRAWVGRKLPGKQLYSLGANRSGVSVDRH